MPYSQHSLLRATLSTLGSAAVVPHVAPKVHSHSCITVVHGHHGHFLSRWPMGKAQAANVGLWRQKAPTVSALSPSTLSGHPRHITHGGRHVDKGFPMPVAWGAKNYTLQCRAFLEGRSGELNEPKLEQGTLS
jgi:hypothetical protein